MSYNQFETILNNNLTLKDFFAIKQGRKKFYFVTKLVNTLEDLIKSFKIPLKNCLFLSISTIFSSFAQNLYYEFDGSPQRIK